MMNGDWWPWTEQVEARLVDVGKTLVRLESRLGHVKGMTDTCR